MLYVVIFEDNPAVGSDIRRQHMPDHLAFLERNAQQIRAAGPLKGLSGGPQGGLWFVEANNPAAVDLLVKEDPFWSTGLRRSVRVLGWTQVFADGIRLI